ncbi:MAG: alpha/beta fold hydrolase [Bacteroidia bacterium]
MDTLYKGLPVHYQISGDGWPLIFLHGFNENFEIWDLIIPEISSNYQCICIDLPGFGKSPLPSNLTIKYMADAVNRVIEELKIIKPIVIGHSMGGYVTLELARQHPLLLSGGGLFHSTALADTEDKKINRIKTLDFLNTNPLDSFFKIFISGLFAPQNLKSGLLKPTENIIHQTSKNSVMAGIKAMLERTDSTDVLKNSSIPWLIVAGKYDGLLPVEQLSLLASYCPMAMFEILFNSGHLGMIEEPEISAEIIFKFANWINSENLEHRA